MRKMQFGKGQVLVVAILAVMFVWMFIRQRDNTQSIGSGEGRKRSSYGGGAALKPRNSDELSSASRVDPAALLGAALASTITVSLSNGDCLWWSTISGHGTHYCSRSLRRRNRCDRWFWKSLAFCSTWSLCAFLCVAWLLQSLLSQLGHKTDAGC